MKSILNLLVISIVLFSITSCGHKEKKSKELVDILEKELETPKNQYSIDLKTKMKDKINLTPMKRGFIDLVNSGGWCTLVETGEDYVVWIENLTIVNDTTELKTSISFDLSLTKKALMRRKENIYTKTMHVDYNSNEDWISNNMSLDKDKFIEFIDKSVNSIDIQEDNQNFKNEIKNALGNNIKEASTKFGITNEKLAQQYLVAGYAYIQLKLWILEIEKENQE